MREASAAHLVRSFKEKTYLDIITQFFVHVYGVNSLAGIYFQQFLKNKMAATANFLLTQNFDDIRSINGKVMNISSPNVYMDIRWHKLGWY